MDVSQEKCANCMMHRWNPEEDESKLQLCANCGLIKYCGKDCQTEHWKKVHKKHCKYFKDPTMKRPVEHKLDNCYICLNATLMGESQIRRPDNPYYECIFDLAPQSTQSQIKELHAHPFPVAGQQGDTGEKVILVLWQLLNKYLLTQPWTLNHAEEFEKVFVDLLIKRIYIWGARKILPPPIYYVSHINLCKVNFSKEIEKIEGREDPFQLWKIIELVNAILHSMRYSTMMRILIDPLSDIPDEFYAVVSQALSNNDKFLDTVNKVMEALATQVIPFTEVLNIIFDGSQLETCYFCTKKLTVANEGASTEVVFDCLYAGIFLCGGRSCRESLEKEVTLFESAMLVVMQARAVSMCDFCFRQPPVKDIHRCSGCLTVVYCSENCLKDDRPIHKEFCKEDVEERKKKRGKSGRRKAARDDLEALQKRGADEEAIQEAAEMMAKFRFPAK